MKMIEVLRAVPAALTDEGLDNVRLYLAARLVAGDYLAAHDCHVGLCGVCELSKDTRASWEAKLAELDAEATRRSRPLSIDRQTAKALNFGMPAGLRPEKLTAAHERGTKIHQSLADALKYGGIPATRDDDRVDATSYVVDALRKRGLLALVGLVLLGAPACGDTSAGLPLPEITEPAPAPLDLGLDACRPCGCGERPYAAPDGCPWDAGALTPAQTGG